MAIRIIEGVPGSGKTYFAVHHLLSKYFFFDQSLSEWVRKPEFSSLVLVTNIDRFPFSVSLDSLIETAGSLEKFFSYEYQENLTSGFPYVYLIDEVQSLFPYTYRDTRVFLFFQKHRHLGIDIYLITQDADHLAKGLRSLAEFHIVAVRRSLSLAGELRYRFTDPNTRECWHTKVLRKDGKIFSFYRSFSSSETESSPSIPRRFIALFLVCVVVVFVIGYFGFIRRILPKSVAPSSAIASSSVSPPVSSPSRSSSSLFSSPPSTSSPPPPSPPSPRSESSSSPSILVVVHGFYDFDSSPRFLVSVNGYSHLLLSDELVRICGCHPEFVRSGAVFVIEPAAVPAVIRHSAAAPATTQWSAAPGSRIMN